MSSTNLSSAFRLPDNITADFAIPQVVAASIAVGIGDLMYFKQQDSTSGDVAYPADQLASLGTEAQDQAQFAPIFIGMSQEQVLAAETNKNKKITILLDGVVELACPSQTFQHGDLVGIFSNGTVLSPQKVDKVTTPGLAIGIVVKDYPVATTTVRFHMMSRYCGDVEATLRYPSIGGNQGAGVTTLTDANQTLVHTSNPILNMVPTAARNVKLPVEAQSGPLGLIFLFTNNSAGAFSVTFQSSAGAGIKGNGVVPQNKTGLFWCDGTNWNGLVSA